MPTLAKLTDSLLLTETVRLVATERSTTLSVLSCLREIEDRQLFAREGFPSLFEMCTKRFGYSEAAALRRIDAMRVLRRVPEAGKKIESGEIKLSQLAQVQTFLRTERKDAGKTYTPEQTLELLTSLQGSSTRETEKRLLEKSPALQARRETAESVRLISPTHAEIKIVADADLLALLEEARGLLAHGADMNPSAASLFKKGLKVLIAQRKKHQGIPEQCAEDSPIAPEFASAISAKPDDETIPAFAPTSRYIPAPMRRAIWQRARARCEYSTPPGVRCTSRHALEVHHLNPYARGGEHSLVNLALYCHGHNATLGKLDFPDLKPLQKTA